VIEIVGAILAAFTVFFRSRLDLSLEMLALRQQVAVLKRKRPRPLLNCLDRFFLDHAADGVAALVRCSGYRETCDRDRVASKRVPILSVLEIQPARWSTQGQRRDSKSHSEDET